MTLLREFALTLRSEGKSVKTIKIYVDAATWLLGSRDAADVTRSDIRQHISGILETRSPSYASNQFRALQQFFKFLAAEENIPNPMAGMKPPKVPPKLVPVIPDDEYAKLIAACSGKRFIDVRDKAIFEFFRATGARRSEVAGLRVTDVDLDQLLAVVTGKGSRMRVVRFDSHAGLALSRYLRQRARHRHGGCTGLWIGVDGQLNPDAVYLVFRRRCEQADVKINPHRFRHDFSHRYLKNGGNEGDLMQQNGWTSPQMLTRYGASAAAERAREHYDRVMR